jgi:small-conductance mechanosensitive channel
MGLDLQEKRQLDLTAQVAAKVKARARPWRSIIALILAVLFWLFAKAVAYASFFHALGVTSTGALAAGRRIVMYGAAGAFFVFAALATIGLAGQARDVMRPRVGSSHASLIRTVLVATLDAAQVQLTQLLLGTAITGVIVGIAAQQSLANFFAGIVLLLARPFQVGDEIWLRSGSLGGQFEGRITEIGLSYVRLDTAEGVVRLPNSQALAAAVGPTSRPGTGPARARPGQARETTAPAAPGPAEVSPPGDGSSAPE